MVVLICHSGASLGILQARPGLCANNHTDAKDNILAPIKVGTIFRDVLVLMECMHASTFAFKSTIYTPTLL